MRGQQRGGVERCLQVLEGVGVDHERYGVEQRRGERLGRVGVPARADHPGLHLPRADHDLRVTRADRVGRPTGVPHHADQPARRARGRQHTGAGIALRAGADADHAAGVLLRGRRGPRQQRRDVVGLEGGHRGLGEGEADVDELDDPAGRRGRLDQVADLVGAEGDRDVSGHVAAVDAPGVDLDPARRVHRDHRDPGEGAHGLERRLAQPRRATDPDDPVHHHVRRTAVGEVDDATAGCAERGHPRLVRAVRDQHRLDPGPAAGQHRPGVQRVATVVARADQQQHASAVRAAQQVDDRGGQPRRRSLHERALGHPGHQLRLRGPYLLDGVRGSHAANLSGSAGSALQDHDGRGDAGVVGEGEVDVDRAELGGTGGHGAGDRQAAAGPRGG